MAEMEKEEFKFPDEVSQEIPENGDNPKGGVEAKADIEIEVEDDTPEEDRNRKPADPESVKKLEVEVDDLDKYSKEAKDKLIRMKRIWNDERRRADAAERERQAAIDAAQRLLEENKKVKALLSSGEKEYVEALTESNELKLQVAKRAYKQAFDAGDPDKMAEAQEEITKATLDLQRAKNFKLPPLQTEDLPVQQYPQQYQPVQQQDEKLLSWQSRNPWFGQDEEMTAAALGLHEKLKRQGVQIGSDAYYDSLDNTMRKRFPEQFDDVEPPEMEIEAKPKADAPKAKPATVVAPATRTTSPKKVRLRSSQVAIAKKLGLTPEQYVRELLKLEA